MRIVVALVTLCAPLAALAQPGPDGADPALSAPPPALAYVAPPPPLVLAPPASRIELGVRVGVAASSYHTMYLEADGAGASLDVELGVRRGRWSVLGYLDYATAATNTNGASLDMTYLGLGARVRFHPGNWFFGVGAGLEAIRGDQRDGSELDRGLQPMLDGEIGYAFPMSRFHFQIALIPQITMVADAAGSLEITRLELGLAF